MQDGRGDYWLLIRFERAVVAEDESGVESEEAWSLIEKAWALPRWGTSAERREAGGQNASRTATFRVLSTAKLREVTPNDRIVEANSETIWNVTEGVPVRGEANKIEFSAATRRG